MGIFFEVLWNQELVLETVIQLIYLGLWNGIIINRSEGGAPTFLYVSGNISEKNSRMV